MKTFSMPVQICGHVEVKANSIDDAIRKYKNLTYEQCKRRLEISALSLMTDDDEELAFLTEEI